MVLPMKTRYEGFRVRALSVALILFVMVGMTLASGGLAVAADDYPTKPITMIVAFSPGGGTDVAARTVAKYAEQYLGQRIVVENRPGAGGQIGFTALAKARPDGYTIGLINIPTINLLTAVRSGVTYQVTDFASIANIVQDPIVLAVPANSPFQTLDDFLTYARENPGKLVIGGDGPQSNNQLQILVAGDALDFTFTYVSYDGAAPALTAALGGHVQATVPTLGEALQYVESGQLRVLAVFANERFPMLPEVPTVKELTGVDVPPVGASSRGIAAPKGVPAERLAKLQEVFAQVMQDPEFIQQAQDLGLPLVYMDGPSLDALILDTQEQIEAYADLLK